MYPQTKNDHVRKFTDVKIKTMKSHNLLTVMD